MKQYFFLSCLAFAVGFSAPCPAAEDSAESGPEERIVRLQIWLDQSPHKPGKIDGYWGKFTRDAVARHDKAAGRTRELDEEAPEDFQLPIDQIADVFAEHEVSQSELDQLGSIPSEPAAKAAKERLPYETLLELVAERYHSDPELIEHLNPDYDWDHPESGDTLKFPNVATPFEVRAAQRLKDEEKETGTPETNESRSKEALTSRTVEIVTSTNHLLVRENGEVVRSYPITPGADNNPAPEGEWEVSAVAWMPTFRYDEKMLKEGERSDEGHIFPPGPNSPVGIVWMALNRDGIGIHGTKDPDTIGRSASHGCIRLSNWDALDLGKYLRVGTPVKIY